MSHHLVFDRFTIPFIIPSFCLPFSISLFAILPLGVPVIVVHFNSLSFCISVFLSDTLVSIRPFSGSAYQLSSVGLSYTYRSILLWEHSLI